MSGSQPAKVFFSDADDPEMQSAMERARATFRYLWREVAWERRRIVPALDLACVKAPFSDGGHDDVEEMWLGDVDFDGRRISGTLLNAPNWLKSVRQGDTARFRLREISDWMYVVDGRAYGGHTVNLMRSRMSARDLKNHDSAWGLEFGNPAEVRLVPQDEHWFAGARPEQEEHPMSKAMAEALATALAENPSLPDEPDDRGWTLLHHESLAGSLPTVTLLLEHGADPNRKAPQGATPLRLANVLGWNHVAAVLAQHGATE